VDSFIAVEQAFNARSACSVALFLHNVRSGDANGGADLPFPDYVKPMEPNRHAGR
jgi:hypothetical protein